MIVLRLRNDNGIQREKVFRSLPIRIGRSAENDFVVLDDSVSKFHALIEQNPEGEIVIRDLASRNGIRVGHTNVTSMVVPRNNKQTFHCMIGLIELEIAPLANEDTRIVNLYEWQQLNRRRSLPDHLRIIFLAIIGWLIYIVTQPLVWSPTREDREIYFFWQLIAISVLMPAISFSLMLILRALGRKLRLADTLQAFTNTIWAFTALSLVSIGCYYLLPVSILQPILGILFVVAIVWTMVSLAELRRTKKTFVFRLTWAVATLTLLLSIEGIYYYGAKVRGEPNTDYLMLPPIKGYAGISNSLERYYSNVEDVAKSVNQQAEKMAKDEQQSNAAAQLH